MNEIFDIPKTREDLIRRLTFIKEIEWIRFPKQGKKKKGKYQHDSKNVGDLMESLLGLETNSFQDPDWGVHEIKSTRRSSRSRVTLTTKVPEYVGLLSAREFTDKYGYQTRRGKALRHTLSVKKPTKKKWQLVYRGAKLEIEKEGFVVGHQTMKELREHFLNKLKHLVLVIADSETRGKWEFFHYNEAYLYTDINLNMIVPLLEAEQLRFEFRMAYEPGWKDYGPAFRMHRKYIQNLYRNMIRII
ncbi:MAG: MvaI/BcnI family restriction endonuclease [Candidatus Thorarchaeota archaeon]